jgi:hypothetical protein
VFTGPRFLRSPAGDPRWASGPAPAALRAAAKLKSFGIAGGKNKTETKNPPGEKALKMERKP